MLNSISSIITPDVYKIIYSMGHLDELAIVDANFSERNLSTSNSIFLPIFDNNILLYELLKYFPLDNDDIDPVYVFDPDFSDTEIPNVWNEYSDTIKEYYNGEITLHKIKRDEFYRKAITSYATIKTLDQQVYANLIIRKGFVLNIEDSNKINK